MALERIPMPEAAKSARVLCFQTCKARLEEHRLEEHRLEEQRVQNASPSVENVEPAWPFRRPLDARQLAHRRAMLVHLQRA